MSEEALKRRAEKAEARAAKLRTELGKLKLEAAFRDAGVSEAMIQYAIDGAVRDDEVEFDEDGTPLLFGGQATTGERLAKDFVVRNPGFTRPVGEGSGTNDGGPVDTDTMNAEELASLGLRQHQDKQRAIARKRAGDQRKADERAALREARGENASPLTQQVADGLRKAGVR